MRVNTRTAASRGILLVCLTTLASDAWAQTWSGGTPYGGSVHALLQAQDAQTLYAGTSAGLFRSDDGGLHWARRMAGSPGSGPAELVGLALADSPAGRIYLADAGGSIHRSDDRGDTIAATTSLPLAPVHVLKLLAMADGSNNLYVVTSDAGLWHSTDAGASFAPADAGMDPDARIVKLVASGFGGNSLMALATTAVPRAWYLGDANSWWRRSEPAGPTAGAFGSGMLRFVATPWPSPALWTSADLGASWSHSPTLWCASPNSVLPTIDGQDVQWLGCDDGLSGTTSPTAPPLLMTASMAPIRELVRDRVTPQRLWAATDHAGVFVSEDEGDTWTARNHGLTASAFRAVGIHPQSRRLFAGYADETVMNDSPGLVYSDDEGLTWAASDLGNRVWTVRAIAVDPTVAAIDATAVYAGGYGWYGQSSLYKSSDGGRSFSAIAGSADIGTVRGIVLDPRSCAPPPASGPCTSGLLQSFYAIANGIARSSGRVVRSDDAGATLQDRSNGLPQPLVYSGSPGAEYIVPLAIALDAHDADTVFIGTYLEQNWSGSGPAPAPALANGVFRSTDGGLNWQAVNTGLPRRAGSTHTAIDIMALATDAHVSGRLWAAGTWDNGSSGSHVYRSDDAGAHWIEQAAFPDCDIRALLADPVRPGTVRASGQSRAAAGTGCVLRSRDGGASWERIDAGLPATSVTAMADTPVLPDLVIAGTNAGVWVLRDAPDLIFADGFD